MPFYKQVSQHPSNNLLKAVLTSQNRRRDHHTCVMYRYRSGPPLARISLEVLICTSQMPLSTSMR